MRLQGIPGAFMRETFDRSIGQWTISTVVIGMAVPAVGGVGETKVKRRFIG